MFQDHVMDLETCLRGTRRMLINGPPNSRKTGSLYTLKGKTFILSAPFEGGTASIPWKNFEGIPIIAKVPGLIDVEKPQNWDAIIKEVWDISIKALSGKFGPIDNFVVDGIHKLYQAMLATNCDGCNLTGDEFMIRAKGGGMESGMGQAYGRTHTQFWRYLWTCMAADVNKVVFLCWDGADKDNALDTAKGAPRHNYPDLPGQAAKKVMGEVPIVLSAGWDTPTAQGRYFWRTRPVGHDYGAGIKLPMDIMKNLKIPQEMAQDFTKFDDFMTKHVTEQYNLLKKEVAT